MKTTLNEDMINRDIVQNGGGILVMIPHQSRPKITYYDSADEDQQAAIADCSWHIILKCGAEVSAFLARNDFRATHHLIEAQSELERFVEREGFVEEEE